MTALARLRDAVGYEQVLYDDSIGKVSLVGAGMRTHPGVSATFFSAMAAAGVNTEMISTSGTRSPGVAGGGVGDAAGRRKSRWLSAAEGRVWVVVEEAMVDAAVASAHAAFSLDSDEVQAVV